MSKSLGNILSIPEVARRVPAEAVRLLYLGTHYRAPLDFSSGRLAETQGALRGSTRRWHARTRPRAAGAGRSGRRCTGRELTPFEAAFCEAMDDDLNAAKAIGLVFDRVRDLNRALDAGNRPEAAAIRAELARVGVGRRRHDSEPETLLADLRARGGACRTQRGRDRGRHRRPERCAQAARLQGGRRHPAPGSASRASCSRTDPAARPGRRAERSGGTDALGSMGLAGFNVVLHVRSLSRSSPRR